MNARSGLSLFELLIALALLALIAVGLSGSLNFAVLVYSRAHIDPEIATHAAMKARVRSWLISAAPPSSITAYPTEFAGEPTRLEFTTTHTKGFAKDAAALRVSLESVSSALILTVSEIDDGGATVTTHNVTAANGMDLVFSYYDTQTEQQTWNDSWNDPSRLPDLIKIDTQDERISDWHAFIVRPVLR
ncbi:prepilin-type N-terminal cleavage/methylation domain-containing protein [Ruegeria sp. EL01]|jgi:prepilin-type N-terminal cleavage/methylation domain-containing protein|uniref:prepilin-type N-terminal cleavage/methylation domain-containing protein n=1 Tax=Ruegeria sp. EL01 TaxID=2107578 RepID=UPI000EA80EEF|nr:prepilin-type N-terminal cleavage/methylation domain-containing protein [Ruegeria sp. EL01]